MSDDRLRSIQSIFLRRLVTTWATVASVCLIVIVIVCVHLRSVGERDAALRHGRLVAAAIEPGRGGAIGASVARIQSRYDGLLAVGTVSSTGKLLEVFPPRKAYQLALQQAVDTTFPHPLVHTVPADSYTIDVPAPKGDALVRATAVLANMVDDKTLSAQRLVILSAAAPGLRTAYFAIMLLWPIGVATVMMFASIYSWFDAALTRPLRQLALALEEPSSGTGHRHRLAIGGGSELVDIATSTDRLIRDLAETTTRQDRFEERAMVRIAERVHSVDQKLRRAKDHAMTDSITRLKNRAFLEENLEAVFELHRRSKQDVCAIMLDLDNFKQHNDRYGHQAGDELLAFTGSLLSGATRPEDVAIRYGGDEFLLIMPDVGPEQAAHAAKRLIRLFAQHARQFDEEPAVSMSAGVASARCDGAATGHNLVAQADRALYQAKNGGKNDVATFSAA